MALAAGLLDRELNKHGWVANDPFFLPTSLLDNMANFQLGIVAGLARFSNALYRTLAQDGVDDSNLKAASLRLMRPGTVWLWDWSQPLKFIGRSESQYREALFRSTATMSRSPKAKRAFPKARPRCAPFLQEMMAGLADASDRLAATAETASPVFSSSADDALYFAKGVAYANSIVLKGPETRLCGAHQEPRPRTRTGRKPMTPCRKVRAQPLFVMNGAPDAFLLPSHLLSEGFRIFRARRALERVVAKLAS